MENLSIISFNSTKVQLEPSSFARSSLLKFCFNSTKVQLEPTFAHDTFLQHESFNSTKVQLERVDGCGEGRGIRFQFH